LSSIYYPQGLFRKVSDTSIVEGIKLQDDKILNWLYDNYYQTVRNHIVRNSGTADDVSDIFQDTIIILYKQIVDNTLNLTTDLKGYFFGISRNLWNVQLRQRSKMTELELDFDIAEETNSDDRDDPMFERILSRAFQKLKPDCQTVLTLYADGQSYEEIAVKLNLKNEDYARRKKYLCKEALMEFVKEDIEYQEYLRFRK
jgi:RNA polymerase sigma factor (sigma-70 family)